MAFAALDTALSALRAAQVGLEVTSNNLANANTPEYQRQSVQLSDRGPIFQNGRLHRAGVDVSAVRNARSQAADTAYYRNIGATNEFEAHQEALQRLESIFNDGEGSLHDQMRHFLTGLRELQTRPGDPTLRGLAIEQAELFSQQIRTADEQMAELQLDLEEKVQAATLRVNELTEEIGRLNVQIRNAEALDSESHGLLNQRDQRVAELAELVGPSVDPLTHTVRFADNTVVVSTRIPVLSVQQDEDGLGIVSDVNVGQLNLTTGRIKGLLEARNEIVDGYRQRLDTFARATRDVFNSIHSTGVGTQGGLQFINGSEGVADVDAPLGQQEGFDLESGNLFVTVTDKSTGEKVRHEIPIEPVTDSLNDLSDRLTSLDNIRTFIDDVTGRLNIVAENGYEFDFSGTGNENIGDLGGTAEVAVSGFWNRPDNESYSLVASGDGTIGVTEDLFVNIVDSNNNIVQSIDLGPDYEPGTPIEFNGLQITFSAGTAVNASQADFSGIGQPDETGLLTALGVNSFFQGDNAANFRVNARILDNPNLFALSRSGDAGDGEFLDRMIDDALNADVENSRGLDEYLVEIAGLTGIQKEAADDILDGLNAEGNQIANDRDASIGVDPNEELVILLQFQRFFETAARVVTTIDRTLDELIGILA